MSIHLPVIDGAEPQIDDVVPTAVVSAGTTAAAAMTTPFVQTSLRTAPASTHRLQRPGKHWNIRTVTLDTFINMPECDYEIVLDLNLAPSLASSITIDKDDRIEISAVSDNILLTHVRKGETVGRGTNFTIDPSGFWAIGTATVPPSTIATGTYYLYLVEDVPNSRHRNAKKLGENGPATQIHIEYFDNNHRLSIDHFPQMGVNVVPKATPISSFLQTDEGDGDEGRRR